MTIGVKRKSSFEPSDTLVSPAPGQYYKYGTAPLLPGGVMLSGKRFDAAPIGAASMKASDIDFIKLNRESREILTAEGQSDAFVANQTKRRLREEAVKARQSEMEAEKQKKDENLLALSRISADDLKAGRRWGALACLGHWNGPKGLFRRIIDAHKAGKKADIAGVVIAKYMYRWGIKRRFVNLEQRRPNIRFAVTLAARCFLRRIRGNQLWRAAKVITTFCREIEKKHKNLYAMKKAVRAVVNFQRFWRRCMLRKEARIALLVKKWMREEAGVLLQAKLDREKQATPTPTQCSSTVNPNPNPRLPRCVSERVLVSPSSALH